MKTLLHKIAHLLALNHGVCDAFYERDRLMMSFLCSCGERQEVHPIDDIVDRELKFLNSPDHEKKNCL